jgi:signal transduction histidine kinase
VLGNLLTNARKYGGAGGSLRVQVTAQGDNVRIEIADRGPGISAAEQQHVFDRFYRAGTAGASRVGGSGLGLAVAREIVERLGGQIGVKSPPDGGARFWVELPRTGAAAERQETER